MCSHKRAVCAKTARYRDHDHGRWSVITANYGRLRGHRIVRGREDDCAAHYKAGVKQTSLF